MSNPYGGSGSIVMTPIRPLVTSRRLGSTGWRLHDTPNGRAIKRTRNGKVTSNRPKVTRELPTLDEATALALVAKLATTNDTTQLNLNIHDK
jgi:hypothetical protein